MTTALALISAVTSGAFTGWAAGEVTLPRLARRLAGVAFAAMAAYFVSTSPAAATALVISGCAGLLYALVGPERKPVRDGDPVDSLEG